MTDEKKDQAEETNDEDIILDETDEAENGENETDTEDKDDEFEYDEDGNIIIPDIDENAEEDDGNELVGEDDSEGEEKTDEPAKSEGKHENEETEQTEDVPDDRDKEIAELREKLRRLESQTKETLEKLGVKEEDSVKGLASLAAEADDVPLEEYLKKRAEKDETEKAKTLYRKVRFEEKMKSDLQEVQKAYPETAQYKSIRDIPNFKRFGELRDAGLSPKEAYIASNPDAVRQTVAQAVRKQDDGKGHLRSNVPVGATDNNAPHMTKAEMREWQELFPNKTQKEILALYQKTK